MNDDTRPGDELSPLHPNIIRDIEAACEAAGDLDGAPEPPRFAAALIQLVCLRWSEAMLDAPGDAPVGEARKEALLHAIEAASTAFAYLAFQVREVHGFIYDADEEELESNAEWLAERLGLDF
ncbi:MAG: hypothetical protein IT301_13320 [Dehalococcoidia bacterium]|nr:hypothetical protein [Dehalococcoidia bacterium]